MIEIIRNIMQLKLCKKSCCIKEIGQKIITEDEYFKKSGKYFYLLKNKLLIINLISVFLRIIIIIQTLFFGDPHFIFIINLIFFSDILITLILFLIVCKYRNKIKLVTIINTSLFLIDLIIFLMLFSIMKSNDKKTIFLISLFYSNIILKNSDFFNEFPYKNIIIICKHLLLIVCLIIALILSKIPGEIFFNLICFEIIFNYGLLILLNKRLVISQNPSNSIEKEKNLIDINEIFYNLNIFYISYNKKNIIFQSKIPKILQIDGKNKFRRLNTFGQKIFKDEIDSLINLFFLKDYKINLKDILDVLLEEKIKVKHLKFNNSSNSFIDESRENARLCVSENPFSFNVNSFLFNRKILKKNILGFTEINDTNNEFNLLGEFLFKERYFNVLYKKEKDILELIITESKIKEIQLKTVTITKPDINFEKKIKQKILSKIAHELKTPINSILVFVRNLMQLTNDLKMRKELINIHSISNVVNYLIKDLIFYSNIEKVESNLNYSSISVKETHYNTKLNAYMLFDTLNALLSCYSSKMKYIKTHLIIENTYENYTINIDEILINQIMINFVSNSVKFTRKGHIYILNKFITKMKNSKNMHFLKISIIDSGIGLDENNLKFLFKESIKSDVNQDYNSQGSKLGLSICLNLAKILDIKIEYFSLENIGSIFSLLIPAKKLKNFSNDTLIRTYKIRKSRSQENPRSKLEMDQPTITDSSFSNEIENDIMNRRLLEEFELVEPEIKFKIKETHMEEKHLEFMETDEYIFNLVKSIRKKNSQKKNKYILNNIDISIDNYEYYESNDAYMWKYTYLENENKSDSKVSNDTISTEIFCHTSNNLKEKEYLINNVKIRQTKTIDFSMINENLCLESQRNYKNYNNNSNLSNNSNENQKGKSNFVKHLFSHRSAKSDQGNYSMSKILSESFEDNSFSEKHSSEIQSFGPKVSYQKCFQKLAKNTINYNNNIDINYSEDINIEKGIIYNYNKKFDKQNSTEPNTQKSKEKDKEKNEKEKEKENQKQKEKEIETEEKNKKQKQNQNQLEKEKEKDNKDKKNNKRLSKFEIERNKEIKFYCKTCQKNECECEYENKSSNSVINKSIFLGDDGRLNSRRSDRNSINKSKSYEDSFVFIIIEDNVNIRGVQKNLLKIVLDKMKKTDNMDFEYTILLGEDGIDALKFVIDPLLSSRIKGIFTDENMEFMNGSESIRIIRNLQRMKKISYFNICTITAFEDKETAMGIKFTGVDEILKKPLKKLQLEDYFVRFPFLSSKDK